MAGDADRGIGATASRHGGHISRAQLLALGASPQEIDYRIRVGRLIRVYQGVYAVGRLPTAPEDQAAGALLACGGRAVLSHGSAAYLYGMLEGWREPIEVTLATDRRPRRLRAHRAKLKRQDIRHHRGLWLTSPARTILDIAPRLTAGRLTRIVNDARLDRVTRLTERQLADVVERFPRHPGARLLRPFAVAGGNPTRSALEDALQRFIEHFGLPRPLINHRIAGYEVDAYFPRERLIVEVDGWRVHRTREAFESDRLKDATILAATGIPTVRITHLRLTRLAREEAVRLRRILDARRERGAG